MSRRCELTGKGTQVGHNVSHANNKTKRIYRPNLQTIALASELLGNSYKLRISMNALRSVDRNGGIDQFILKCKDSTLSPRALRLKGPTAVNRQKKGLPNAWRTFLFFHVKPLPTGVRKCTIGVSCCCCHADSSKR